MRRSIIGRWVAALAVGAATGVAVPAAPAPAAPAGDNLVINEIYNNGGSSGSSFANRYYTIYNPTDKDISVNGWSLQYRAATGTAFLTANTPLGDKHVEPKGSLVVKGASNNAAVNPGAVLPFDVDGALNSAAGSGVVALSTSTAQLANGLTDPNLVDLVGYGTTATLYEGTARAPGGALTVAIKRKVAGVDTNDNLADFTTGAPAPVACGTACDGPGDSGGGGPEEPSDPVDATISEIQGTGPDSPLAGKTVTTRGIVTAVYKTGGFDGGYIQTAGTGGAIDLATHKASQGLFVFDSAFAAGVQKGDYVEVTGVVSEFNGLTELTTSAGNFSKLTETAAPVAPARVSFPLSQVQRESLEGMLLLPQGDLTVTNNYTTNQYAEIGLADGKQPLQTPTDVVAPGAPAVALLAANKQRLVNLDDGSSINFLAAANQSIPLPWLKPDNEVRVGSAVTFDDPVVLDWRNSVWKLQPTEHLTATGNEPVTFSSTRQAKPAPVGGDVRISSFNVLNYFPTTAADYVGAGRGTCTTYKDRAGNPVTANTCSNNGPRGAADDANLLRQQAKIVKAINTLDSTVVSLEEIENSRSVDPTANRDQALATLVAALNADAGEQRWTYIPTPAAVPANEDVIRTAFIYQAKIVSPVGASSILIGSDAFSNARPPLAQTFKLTGGADASKFAVIVNHFKSKGSGSRPEDADAGDGQGPSNYSRKLQATALVEFADAFGKAAGTDRIFLSGDFNSYDKEEPLQILEAAKYVNVTAQVPDKETYQFDGMVGSLDHVFASPAAYERVTGADIWSINANEALAREYSRYNYNATILWKADQYRASDHDPGVVGFTAAPDALQESSVSATADTTAYGEPASVDATVTPEGATGTVTVLDGQTRLGTADVSSGAASVALSADLAVGTYKLTVAYSGDVNVAPSRTTVDLTVTQAATTTSADVPRTVRIGTELAVGVMVDSATGTTPSGWVTVSEGSTRLGTGLLRNGTVVVDAGALGIGSRSLTIEYPGDAEHKASSTSAAVQVLKSDGVLGAKVSPATYGTSAVVQVTGGPGATGLVYVGSGDSVVGIGMMVDGAASIRLASSLQPGAYSLRVFYAGSSAYEPSDTAVTLTVAKAATSIRKISVSPTTIVRKRTKPFVELRVAGAGFTVDGGQVTVRASGKKYSGTVSNGKVRIRLGTFSSSGSKKKVTATFAGNGVANGSSTSFTVKVRRK